MIFFWFGLKYIGLEYGGLVAFGWLVGSFQFCFVVVAVGFLR